MSEQRVVPAVHGRREAKADQAFEIGLADFLRSTHDARGLAALYGRHIDGDDALDMVMRRAVMRALARKFGHGVDIARGVMFRHPETFSIGNGVFIGEQAVLHGRFDGRCEIADHVWIGPQVYFDARDLVIEEYVGWGPGAKVLGSMHTGEPATLPIIQTDLTIRPVVVEAGADIGVNATILPGVRIGRGAIVGAGAVVTEDVEAMTVVAGVPARVIKRR